jgi:hypothetical protein
MGLEFWLGALIPSGAISPRFVITAEFERILSQRIFRFFDLHLGLRTDVDSSGTILGTVSLGTRLFTPVSLSHIPFFLDLRTGLVAGQVSNVGPEFQLFKGIPDILLVGASGEARVGMLKGNFGGSIGYRHIWGLLRNNPNLREITISGEVKF